MKTSKKKEIFKKEQEDALGIKRRPTKNVNLPKSIKILTITKLILLGLAPLVYFLYSPLLIGIFAIFALLFFYSKSLEKNANRDMPKRLHIKVFRLDGLLAVFLIILSLILAIVPLFTSSKKGMFASKTTEEITAELEERGMDEDEIEEFLERAEQGGDNNNSREIENAVINFCSLGAGEWVLFEKNSSSMEGGRGGGDMGGGRFEGMEPPGEGSEMPSDLSGDSAMGPPEGMSMAGNVPFSMIFKQIGGAVCIVLMVITAGMGVLSVFSFKKLKQQY